MGPERANKLIPRVVVVVVVDDDDDDDDDDDLESSRIMSAAESTLNRLINSENKIMYEYYTHFALSIFSRFII
jgi:hypothetical protein